MDIRNFFGSASKGNKRFSLNGGDKKTLGGNSIKKSKAKPVKKLAISDSDDDDDAVRLQIKTKARINSSDVIIGSDEEENLASDKVQKKKIAKEKPVIRTQTTPIDFFASASFKAKSAKSNAKRKASDEIASQRTEKKTKQETAAIKVDYDDDELSLPPLKPIVKSEPASASHGVGKSTISKKLAERAKATPSPSTATHKSANGDAFNVKQEASSSAREERTHIMPTKPTPSSVKHQSPEQKTDVKSVKLSTSSKKVGKVSDNKSSVLSPANQTNNPTPKKANADETVISATPLKDKVDVIVATPSPSDKNTADESTGSTKKDRFMKFQQWQNRAGPARPGSKEVPQGADNCLEGLTFVITGVQESLTREEITSQVERYGGKVTSAVSGRTSFLISGVDGGASKMKKAAQHKTKIIDEDEFLDLIRTRPGKKSKYDVSSSSVSPQPKPSPSSSKRDNLTQNSSTPPPKPSDSSERSPKAAKCEPGLASTSNNGPRSGAGEAPPASSLMWVDKYKPSGLQQIIGQQGAQSNMNKLKKWLVEWHRNHRAGHAKPKPRPAPWGGGGGDGSAFRAALLSGPPGVGKTTTSTLVCQNLGYTYVELNASDKRSKRSLKEDVGESLDNTSIATHFGLKSKTNAKTNHVIIMDEVDGMAGNEDRGGMQELIQLIKSTKIPIICMCNDRSSPKVRSLANHCFDLRFQRPRVEQITGAVMSICYKEGLQVQAPAVQAVIRGCNQDVRQVLHNLNMLKSNSASLTYDEAKENAENSHKDVNIGLFEIARKLLSAESASSSLAEKLDLFFMDYSMIPNFVQENYPHVNSFAAKGDIRKRLDLMTRAADCIASADLVETVVRKNQSWSMLPTVGLLSTALPCTLVAGGMSGMINFPALLGKISTTGKNRRLLQELKLHSALMTGGMTEQSFNLDLATYLKWHLLEPLLTQTRTGVSEAHRACALLDGYDLTKEDFDALLEVMQFSGRENPMTKIDSKVKSAFTRMYNKESHSLPYTVAAAGAKKRRAAPELAADEEQVDEASADEDNDDPTVDGMIKMKKTAKGRKGQSQAAASSSNAKRKKTKK